MTLPTQVPPSRKNKMTLEERISRDGNRWRYIYYLERELDRRRTRQIYIRSVTVIVIAQWLALGWLFWGPS